MPKKRLSEAMFRKQWKTETKAICKIQTYRSPDLDNADVNGRLIEVRQYLYKLAEDFSEQVTTTKFVPFQWCANIKDGTDGSDPEDLITNTDPSDDECKNSDYWLFGFRFGAENPENRVCIICHLDTVPATEGDPWAPFDPHVEERDYEYENCDKPSQNFLVGRGCVDDKGPAISAMIAARTLAKKYDESPYMEKTTVEIFFDTSEETDMATPHYLEDPKTNKPDFGIVYDAQWCVRAEKGGERPVFSVEPTPPSSTGIYIHSLETSPNNSTNTIPDWCKAVIKGDPDVLTQFASQVEEKYNSFVFDDKDYRRAPFEAKVIEIKGVVKHLCLETKIVGAQHGSAPEENRKNGANPLVSLANFLAGQVEAGEIKINDYATIADFITWTWGTKVFGEHHPALLYKFDDVFEKGNGTTYAVTKVSEPEPEPDTEEPRKPTLEVDIRYAVPHHENQWDGQTEGMLPGEESKFKDIFASLVDEYNSRGGDYVSVSCDTKTIFAPDIRTPDSNENFKIVEQAYYDVRGFYPPRFAIGGGTDAKGYVFLLAVGPLMAKEMGPPINYHGIDEGAPMHDMSVSTDIVVNLMSGEIERPPLKTPGHQLKSISRVRALRRNGYKHQCGC